MKSRNGNIDFTGDELSNLKIPSKDTADIDAELSIEGRIGYDNTTKELKYRDDEGVQKIANKKDTQSILGFFGAFSGL